MTAPIIADHIWQRDAFTLSTKRTRLDMDWIHFQLAERAYWAKGQSRAATGRAIAASLPCGLYHVAAQLGFGGRLTTSGLAGAGCRSRTS